MERRLQWVNRCVFIVLPGGPLSFVDPIATFQGMGLEGREVPTADIERLV
jgi:hypothetical protein